jgi:hypothetical protein
MDVRLVAFTCDTRALEDVTSPRRLQICHQMAPAPRQTSATKQKSQGFVRGAKGRITMRISAIPLRYFRKQWFNKRRHYVSRSRSHYAPTVTDQQLAQQNQPISQSNQQGSQDRSLLLPTIQSLPNSTSYTPQGQSDTIQQSLGAANTAFDALRQSAANHAAATNDTAGYGDLTAQLGREQAQTDASTAQQNQIAFTNQAYKEQQAGLNALSQTYGIDTNLLGKATGVPA